MLESERRRRGLTQAEVGERIGVSQATIDRWERGQNPPVATYWTALGRFLDVPRAEVAILAAKRRNTGADQAKRLDMIEKKVDDLTSLVVAELARRQKR